MSAAPSAAITTPSNAGIWETSRSLDDRLDKRNAHGALVTTWEGFRKLCSRSWHDGHT